ESELAGKTLQDVDFRSMFSAGVVGIRRGDKRLEGQLGKIPLRVGDCLLLAVSADFRQHRNLDRNFHLLSGSFTRPQLNRKESLITLGGFATVISLAAANWLPLFHGLLILLGALLLLKVISMAELRRRSFRAMAHYWLCPGHCTGTGKTLARRHCSPMACRPYSAVMAFMPPLSAATY
ncbi:hypothetical protein DK37_23795, partial [Halomonas sp. SUBG004]